MWRIIGPDPADDLNSLFEGPGGFDPDVIGLAKSGEYVSKIDGRLMAIGEVAVEVDHERQRREVSSERTTLS